MGFSVWGRAAAARVLEFEGKNYHYAAAQEQNHYLHLVSVCKCVVVLGVVQPRATFFFQCGGGYSVPGVGRPKLG